MTQKNVDKAGILNLSFFSAALSESRSESLRLSSESRIRGREIQGLEQRLGEQERQALEASAAKSAEVDERSRALEKKNVRISKEAGDLRARLDEKERDCRALREKIKQQEMAANERYSSKESHILFRRVFEKKKRFFFKEKKIILKQF